MENFEYDERKEKKNEFISTSDLNHLIHIWLLHYCCIDIKSHRRKVYRIDLIVVVVVWINKTIINARVHHYAFNGTQITCFELSIVDSSFTHAHAQWMKKKMKNILIFNARALFFTLCIIIFNLFNNAIKY